MVVDRSGWAAARTLVLPDTLAGVSTAGVSDFGADGAFGRRASKDLGMSVAGRGYGGVRGVKPLQMNLVVAGGDAEGELDIAFAGGTSTRVGRVSCTQTLDVDRGGPQTGRAEPTRILC